MAAYQPYVQNPQRGVVIPRVLYATVKIFDINTENIKFEQLL